MTKRSIAVLGVLALSLVTIEAWRRGNPISVQAFESSSSSTSPAQTASPDPRAVTWEYKVLIGSVPGVVVARVTSTAAMGPFGLNVEEEINKLSAQGWVVESFQPCCSRAGNNAPGVLYGPPEITVLLRRMRK